MLDPFIAFTRCRFYLEFSLEIYSILKKIILNEAFTLAQPGLWSEGLFCFRNHGMGDTSIKFEVIPGKNQKSEYVMTCGKHTVKGWCK